MVLSPVYTFECLGSGLFNFILNLRICDLVSSTKAILFVSICFFVRWAEWLGETSVASFGGGVFFASKQAHKTLPCPTLHPTNTGIGFRRLCCRWAGKKQQPRMGKDSQPLPGPGKEAARQCNITLSPKVAHMSQPSRRLITTHFIFSHSSPDPRTPGCGNLWIKEVLI